MAHFFDANAAGASIGISGHAFRKRASRYGVAAVKALGKPPAGNRKGIAHRRAI